MGALSAAGGPATLSDALLAWYASSGRILRFRATTDPWAVLVAEVMAQQTQVSRVEPAWSAFLARFPTARVLADATPADVLRAWTGMGYNRRAVNLQRAARVIVERHGGRVPASLAELEALPGIGPYTARAVAAICFGIPVAPVDTNVRRVVSRLVGRGTLSPKDLQAAADALIDRGRPGHWTHAAMDLAATVCRPRPLCDDCPLRPWCAGSGEGRSPAPSARAGSRTPFPLTRRWLRGRIVSQLRDAPARRWQSLVGPVGEHGPEAVAGALQSLERDGLVERDRWGRVRLPG